MTNSNADRIIRIIRTLSALNREIEDVMKTEADFAADLKEVGIDEALNDVITGLDITLQNHVGERMV